MKIQYANELNINMGVGWFYNKCLSITFAENGSNGTKNIQCVLPIRNWSFSHNTELPISIRQNKYVITLNTNTAAMFDWGAVNLNKNKT